MDLIQSFTVLASLKRGKKDENEEQKNRLFPAARFEIPEIEAAFRNRRFEPQKSDGRLFFRPCSQWPGNLFERGTALETTIWKVNRKMTATAPHHPLMSFSITKNRGSRVYAPLRHVQEDSCKEKTTVISIGHILVERTARTE